MTKTELRQSLREKQGSLTKEYIMQANQGILSRFLMYPVFQQVDSIFTYVSTEEEPDTSTILETAWQMGKLVAVPRCLPGSDGQMEAVPVTGWEDLVPGRYGILAPKPELPAIDAYKLALGVIPCVSADRFGHRLGHGKGYYDRFLAGQSMYKYCLCFEAMLSEEVPTEETDITMDRIFTEDRIYNPRMQSEDLAGELHRESAGKRLLQGLRDFRHRAQG